MDKRFPLQDQIEMLGSTLRGRVVSPLHAEYDAVRAVALGNFDRRPAAVIRVGNAADVAAVLNFARTCGLELAVRSGGHSVPGHSGTDGGLVIDLRDLNGFEIDHEARTIWAGAEGSLRLRAAYPGTTWDRLRRIKRQYDPQNLFRLNQNIPPT